MISLYLWLSLWLMLQWWSLNDWVWWVLLWILLWILCLWVGCCVGFARLLLWICDWVLVSIFIKFWWCFFFSFYWPFNLTAQSDHPTAQSDHLNGRSTDWVFGNPTQSSRVINFPQTQLAWLVPTCRHPNLYRLILMVPGLSDDNLRFLI